MTKNTGQRTALTVLTFVGFALGLLITMIGGGAPSAVAIASGLFGLGLLALIGWIVLAGVESALRQIHGTREAAAEQPVRDANGRVSYGGAQAPSQPPHE